MYKYILYGHYYYYYFSFSFCFLFCFFLSLKRLDWSTKLLQSELCECSAAESHEGGAL